MEIINQTASYRQRLQYKAMQFIYRKHACSTHYNWDWRITNFNRISLVNLLVNLNGGLSCKYLELGCAGNDLFDSVFCKKKVGIDPERGGTNRETSDEFFTSNTEIFDVVFIDGLHEYEQVRRDAVNSINCLSDGGWIAFHDFLPRDWKEHHVPMLQGTWTGDCWKLAVELAQSHDVDFRILNIDHGVGIMRPRVRDAKIIDLRNQLKHQQYDYFVSILEELPRVDWVDGVEWIKSYSNA